MQLARTPDAGESSAYLATVAEKRTLVAAAVWTPPHSLVLHIEGARCQPALEALARELLSRYGNLPGVIGTAPAAGEFAQICATVAGGSYRLLRRQRVFRLDRVIHPAYSPGRLRPAGKADVELLARWLAAFYAEAVPELPATDFRALAASRMERREAYLWEDGWPVSLATSSRPTAHGIAISAVYTPPELRRRGYAGSCVAALSQQLLDSGHLFCVLHADRDNPTANDIYQKIGNRPLRDMDEYAC